MAVMMVDLEPERIERCVADQVRLAALAVCPEVKAMHLDLAALYRAQLGYLLASRQLDGLPRATPRWSIAA